MIDLSKGRYWDLPWSLVDGCTPCSSGCDNCWSAAIADRFCPGYTILNKRPPTFDGFISVHPERLTIPLKRKKPTVYAVWNDLFHESVSDQFLYEVTRVMRHSFAAQHTFLIRTKRPERMRLQSNLYDELPNVWSGLTVCNQQEADDKIPTFLHVPGKKFLSIEPMLGEIKIRPYTLTARPCFVCKIEDSLHEKRGTNSHPINCGWRHDSDGGSWGIDAVILGGETGPGARPTHPDWVRSVRDQCQAAGVPLFFKQWGEWEPVGPLYSDHRTDAEEDRWADEYGRREAIYPSGDFCDPGFQPGPNAYLVERVGRKKAGRLLDGRTHDDLPWVKS